MLPLRKFIPRYYFFVNDFILLSRICLKYYVNSHGATLELFDPAFVFRAFFQARMRASSL